MLLSEEDLRFTHTYKQGFDTSCGIAATATLLSYFWNIPISEEEMYLDMIVNSYQERDIIYNVTFLTIANYLRQKGIQTRAYKMDWQILQDTLEKGFTPILIHYEKPTPHFALLVHIENNYAFVSDPARGFELVERNRFTEIYSGNAMLTASPNANKNLIRIEQIQREENIRLDRLQKLARIRGRR